MSENEVFTLIYQYLRRDFVRKVIKNHGGWGLPIFRQTHMDDVSMGRTRSLMATVAQRLDGLSPIFVASRGRATSPVSRMHSCTCVWVLLLRLLGRRHVLRFRSRSTCSDVSSLRP